MNPKTIIATIQIAKFVFIVTFNVMKKIKSMVDIMKFVKKIPIF